MERMTDVKGQYDNRKQAGQILAERLEPYRDKPDLMVLGLPRGGVPVAFEVAQWLHAPLDIFTVRKLGVPRHEELAMGAIAPGGLRVINDSVVEQLGISKDAIDEVAERELQELQRREEAYRKGREAPSIRGKTVILVDDGLATGSSMRAAVASVKEQRAGKVIIAVPVAAPETAEEFRQEVDELVCPLQPSFFQAVGLWYKNFGQTSDEEVVELLERAQRENGS